MDSFQPLSEITVLDLSWLVPGPYATCMLGDLGANVIKIERPGRGDYLRSMYADEDSESAQHNQFFDMLNRNKQSLSLNLKDQRGREIFYELVANAEVVIESFSPGTAEELGVDFETVQNHNENIIYCSITGYGQSGPYRDHPGHDINYEALSGIASLSSQEGDKPPIPGTTIADLSGGVYACFAVVAAMQQDSSQYIDVSMADILTTWTLPLIFKHFAGDSPWVDGQTRHQRHPSYGFYETKDEKYISIAAVEYKFWKNLCDLLDLDEFRDDHRSASEETREQIRDQLEAQFRQRTRDEWVTVLMENEIPCSPVNEIDELEDSEHVRSRGLIFSEDSYGKQFRFPVKFSGTLDETRSPPPDIGEHNDEILSMLDVTADERKSLRQDGII